MTSHIYIVTPIFLEASLVNKPLILFEHYTYMKSEYISEVLTQSFQHEKLHTNYINMLIKYKVTSWSIRVPALNTSKG